MRKIVINECYGGFGLSDKGIKMYKKLSKSDFTGKRDDPTLVKVVEKLGPLANGLYSKLKIVEIPNDVKWQIGEYDGIEWVAEVHRRWD